MTNEPIVEKKPLNRREFLNFAWLVSIGFFTVTAAGVTYLFSLPRFAEGEFGGIVTIGPVGELPATTEPPANYPKVKLWLSNMDQGVMALYKVCTHLGCLYNWNNQEFKFICPCHGSQFQKDGIFIQGPAPRSLDRFVVIVEDANGNVIAETDPENGGPVQVPADPNAVIKVDTGKRIQGAAHA